MLIIGFSINKITKKTEVIFFGNKDKEFYLLYTVKYTQNYLPRLLDK